MSEDESARGRTAAPARPPAPERVLVVMPAPRDDRTLRERLVNWLGGGRPGERFNPERKDR